jgi:eukaryotic-like serine/threonine-protein kinase
MKKDSEGGAIRPGGGAADRTLIAEVGPDGTPRPGSAALTAALRQVPAARTSTRAEDSQPSSNPLTGDQTGSGALLRPGTRIHHYELIRQLGRGGMGSVFLARDTRLGRKVAIKFLHTDNPELTQRFILEARTTARCSHENIVVIYEVGEFRGGPYMVLEYLQGTTLSDLLPKGRRMPAARAVELMAPVVRALACAHEQNIVHRDLKPANILISESGTIKVLDFGIAKVLQSEDQTREAISDGRAHSVAPPRQPLHPVDSNVDTAELTRQGAFMGTLPFMAPEQWRPDTPIDHRADIWAVGILLFRMLAGKHPLDPLVGEQLYVTGLLDEPMPRLGDAVPELPPALCEAVDRCLKKRKEERFADALSLLRALEPHLPGRFTQQLDLSGSESPYAGLSSFQETDAHRFFGRTREIAAFVHRLADRPLLGVVGTSGSGKSSFVRAGVVPALKGSGEAWESLVVRPGRSPLAALCALVAPLINTSASVQDDLEQQAQIAERLRAEPGYVGQVLRSRARREKRRVLLFVDQFEELYTLVHDPKERLAFTACLAGIADDATAPTRVVLSIRSDFLDRASEDRAFMAELSLGLFFLHAPDRAGLRDALVQPAEMVGYRFEAQELVEHMLDHLETTPGALPLLQFAASRLWDTRDPSHRLLTRHSYETLGGIAGALASHADAVISELSSAHRTLARAVLLRLVTPERTRAIVSVSELLELARDPSDVQQLIDHLVSARLLVVQTDGAAGGTAELVHESLIHSWPALRRWLEESQEDASFLEQLRNAARQWNAKGRDPGLLWRGEVVEEARRFARRFRGELPSAQRAFLQEVFAQQLRAARRRRALTVGGGVVVAALLAAAAVALVVIRTAQQDAELQAAAAREAAGIALEAEAEARKRLEEVRAKEAERQAASQRAEEASFALQEKNSELLRALHRAEQARQNARVAQLDSEQSAEAARDAREDAVKAAKELEKLLAREQSRVRRLQDQLGSPLVEVLKR